MDREQLIALYHGMDHGPCQCGGSIFWAKATGELVCRECGPAEPRKAAIYPASFVVIRFQGRDRLCEERRAWKHSGSLTNREDA